MTATKILRALLPLALLCCPLAATPSSAGRQEASAEGARTVLVRLAELSRKGEVQTEAARRLMTGELLGLKIESFGRMTDAPDKVVMLEDGGAVGRFQLSGEDGQVTDVYFYLRREGSWKVSEVRLLALTGIVEMVYLGLKAKPALTEEERGTFENLRLTLAPDAELKAWFAANSRSLAELSARLRTRSKGKALSVDPDDKTLPEEASALRKLHLSTAGVGEDGNVEFVIGGVTDNTVGFIHSPSKDPPKMSPSEYIWVEKVAPGWYLFRTT